MAPGASGGVFNIACAFRFTVNELIRKITADLRTSVRQVHVDARPGDIRHSFADISAAEAVLGFSPLVRFDEGLKKTISWYQDMKGTP